MQIHEITEGFLRNVASGFAQGLTGIEMPKTPAPVTPQPSPPQTRTVVAVDQPGQTAPAKYYKTGNVWTNELGQEVKGIAQRAYLDKLVPTHGRTEPISTQTADPATAQKTRRVSRRRKAQ